MTLEEKYRKILCEAVANGDIIYAIEHQQVIRFYYEGDENTPSGVRSGEVYAFGRSKDGNDIVRIYQLRGATSSYNMEFKTFRVDKMSNIEFVREFYRPRPNFNPNDDRSMDKVYKIVEF